MTAEELRARPAPRTRRTPAGRRLRYGIPAYVSLFDWCCARVQGTRRARDRTFGARQSPGAADRARARSRRGCARRFTSPAGVRRLTHRSRDQIRASRSRARRSSTSLARLTNTPAPMVWNGLDLIALLRSGAEFRHVLRTADGTVTLTMPHQVKYEVSRPNAALSPRRPCTRPTPKLVGAHGS